MGRVTQVLLVDDDEQFAALLGRAFSQAATGVQLQTATDGQEALAALRPWRASSERRVVLLDLHMPRMDGIELLRRLRSDPKLCTIPVVILTASTDARDREEPTRLGVAGFIVKPTEFARLVDLARALGQYWSFVELP